MFLCGLADMEEWTKHSDSYDYDSDSYSYDYDALTYFKCMVMLNGDKVYEFEDNDNSKSTASSSTVSSSTASTSTASTSTTSTSSISKESTSTAFYVNTARDYFQLATEICFLGKF